MPGRSRRRLHQVADVDVEQRVRRLHGGSHRVLGREDAVARRLGELAEKAKLTEPSGTTWGLSPAWRGMKNDVTEGIMTGTHLMPPVTTLPVKGLRCVIFSM